MTTLIQPNLTRIFTLLGLLTVFSLLYTLSSAFSGFSWFDDEGTILISIRELAEGHRMYDEVYSLYGPAFNLFYWLIYGPLGVPPTHAA